MRLRHVLAGLEVPARRADARRDETVFAARVLDGKIADRGPNLLGNERGAGRRRVRQQHDELLAAIARRRVAGATNALADALRHGGQRLVARLMAVRVVVGLEAVDIDEEQREHIARAPRTPPPSSRISPNVRRLFRPVRPSVLASSCSSDSARMRRRNWLLSTADNATKPSANTTISEPMVECALPPCRVDVLLGDGDHHDHRQVRQVLERVEAAHVVDGRRVREAALGFRDEAPIRARLPDVAPDDAHVVRLAA